MSFLTNKIGVPTASIEVPDGMSVISHQTEDEDGRLQNHYWTVKLPTVGELRKLYSILTIINGMDESVEGELILQFPFTDLEPYPPRMTELALLVVHNPTVNETYGKIAHEIRTEAQMGTSSN